ncbi:fumarate reductase subunit FrdD [Nonomuraea soli]|uniref:Fumarate reductase subunit D n=1 Tax=Nonomuraea soli TaxID=1032476 RepID=A0A7W0CPA8_9ACTN|nr:fumarate reductase subunit FrdD [Nonomuraea soli]MBA2894853.1 fumarate reductase subunit D [Nonomuraea soli]
MRRKRTAEPYLWLLFSGGGVAAAFFLPVLILLFGVLVPAGVVGRPDVAALTENVVVRLAIVVIFTLCLFHAAHRIRFTSEELLNIGRIDLLLAVVCYGGALAGGVVTAVLLF